MSQSKDALLESLRKYEKAYCSHNIDIVAAVFWFHNVFCKFYSQLG